MSSEKVRIRPEETVIDLLLRYGLSRKEAGLYVFLVKIGPSGAGEIARKLRINRMSAYRTLERLRERGLVESTIGRPVMFSALPIDKALDLLIRDARRRVQEMESNREFLMAEWSKIPVEPAELAEPKFRISQGRQQVYGQLSKTCENAKREIRIITTRNDLYRFSNAGIDDALKSYAEKGVSIKIMTEIDKTGIEAAENYGKFAELRHITLLGPTRFIIMDDREVIVSITMDDSMSLRTEQDIGLWTDAKDYVTAMGSFFDKLWSDATHAASVIESIKSGRPVEEIKIIKNHEDYYDLYIRTIASSQSEILLATTSLTSPQIPPVAWQLIKDLPKRGVQVRLLTTVDQENLGKVRDAMSFAEVRHIELQNAHYLIADNREVLLTIATGPHTQSVWSNMGAYVDTVINVVEWLWLGGINAEYKLLELEYELKSLDLRKLIKQNLKQKGWEVEEDGFIKGSSGIRHRFKLIANNLEKSQSLLIETQVGREKIEPRQLVEFCSKALDVRGDTNHLLLLASPGLRKEAASMANLYGIKTIEGVSVEELASKFEELMGASFNDK